MQKEIWVQIGSRNFNLPIQHLYTKTNHFWGEKICQYRRCIQWCIHLTATGEPDKNVHTPPMMTPPSAKTKQNQRQFCVYLPFSWNLYHFSLFIHYNLVSLFFNYSIEFKYIIVLYFFFSFIFKMAKFRFELYVLYVETIFSSAKLWQIWFTNQFLITYILSKLPIPFSIH